MNGQPRHFYEFDCFRVEVEERRLLRDGVPVQLTSKVFDILLALVENSGKTVEKDALMEKVWADTFVEEGNLNRNVSTLRRILGDDSREQKFIKTIPKHGYRFTANVREILEENEAVKVEKLTRSHFIYREETEAGFWTRRRIFLLIAAFGMVVLFGAAGFLWNKTRNGAKETPALEGASNPEAYENYRKGRTLWQTRNAEDLHEATLALEQAVREDSNFALAYAALADAYAFDYTNWKKAESTAREAIRIEPNLGEPHAAIGFVRMFWQWKLYEAEAEFKQAVALSPDYATGHQWFAANLAATLRIDAALAEIKKAVEIEPLSPAVNADYCQILYFAGRLDEAIAQCQKTLQLNANFFNAHRLLYEIYAAKGMDTESVDKFIEAETLSNLKPIPEVADRLRRAFANGGINSFRRAQIEYFTASGGRYRLAQIFARMGEKEKALQMLAMSCENREFDFIFIMADPAFSQLRNDPRMSLLWHKLSERKPE